MLVSLLPQIRAKDLGIDWVPPAMGALDDDIEVIRVDVHLVLRSVVADRQPDVILQIIGDGMLAGIHVRHLGLLQTLGEFLPCPILNVVRFTNIQAPNVARWVLQHAEEMEDLIVSHAFVEVLNVQGLTIGILLQGIEDNINRDGLGVRVRQVLFHLEDGHIPVVVLKLRNEGTDALVIQDRTRRLPSRPSDVVAATSSVEVISEDGPYFRVGEHSLCSRRTTRRAVSVGPASFIIGIGIHIL
mmetsp:Transcript_32048/g.94302  ORF Transcript_32048/g.94302 Transcript_32048/m.94302 type:complete len:243 (-) Transcript_32048:2162-2890(-)